MHSDPDRNILLKASFEIGPYKGSQWLIQLPEEILQGDLDLPLVSGLRVFEDDVELGPAHAGHQEIADLGGGRFSHWGNALYFSTSDGSDPRTNGRSYSVFWDNDLHEQLAGKVTLSIFPPTTLDAVSAVRLDGPVTPPLDQLEKLLSQIKTTSKAHLSEQDRFALAEALAHAAYPDFRFSEFGRSFLTQEKTFWDDYRRFMDPGNWHSHDRKYALKELLKLTRHIGGHFAECGVYTGGSAHLMCREATTQGRRVHLFDSFEGLSEPGPSDGQYWHAGGLAVSEGAVTQALEDWECFDLFKGWIPEGFKQVEGMRYAFVHLDLDLEAPTSDSLAFFLPRMESGGVILLDDYGFDSCPGVKKAADSAFAARSETLVSLPTGQAFVIIH
jgi:O-methyltransferase